MPNLDNRQIDIIARQIVGHLSMARNIPDTSPDRDLSNLRVGIFPDINSAVDAVTVAQKEFIRLPLSKRDKIIASIRKSMFENARRLAELAQSETGLGRIEDK